MGSERLWRHQTQLRDKTNVGHHGTPPKMNKGAGKPKDTLATGTSDSPRARQDDLARIAWPCSRRRQKFSPSRKRSAGISKPADDQLGAQTKRSAELCTAYADQRRAQQSRLEPLRTLTGCNEDADSIYAHQVRRRRSAAAAQTTTLRESRPGPLEGP